MRDTTYDWTFRWRFDRGDALIQSRVECGPAGNVLDRYHALCKEYGLTQHN